MPAYLHKLNQRQLAFTLLELSIVLVVVGLLAAGILVGSDLIQAARIRAQISQLEAYTTAVNTFKIKYGGIPGDLTAVQAEAYDFAPRSGASAHGDGNGSLESCRIDSFYVSDFYFGCETALFWRDLAEAGMIAGNFSSAVDDFINIGPDGSSQYLPEARLGGGNYLSVFSEAQQSVFSTNSIDCIDSFCFALSKSPISLGSANYLVRDGVTPYQAYVIDTKIDDGLPLTGSTLSGSVSSMGAGFSLYYIPLVSNTRCVTTTQTYDIGAQNRDQARCIMNFIYRSG